MIFGVSIPRPKNNSIPSSDYETIILKSNGKIECWSILKNKPKGTVILFHFFGGDKSSMIDNSEIFLELGYKTFLVDFMGLGCSEGKQTSIDFLEAEQVKTCFGYI